MQKESYFQGCLTLWFESIIKNQVCRISVLHPQCGGFAPGTSTLYSHKMAATALSIRVRSVMTEAERVNQYLPSFFFL